jgi:thioredoxin reductase (NADPH)
MTDDQTPDQPEDIPSRSKAKKADPFAGLTIDFGGGVVDAVPLGGNGANGSGGSAGSVPIGGGNPGGGNLGTAGNLGGPISFGSPIVFDAPAPAVEPRAGHPGGGGTGDNDRDPARTKLLIIGSGPAGLTAAIYASRANLDPIVLAGVVPGGQLMITSDVENYPGFPEGILGPELMAKFREQAERFGSRIHDVDVERVDLSSRPFGVWARGVEYRADSIIVATGASALWLGLESETRLRGRGVSACATCDGFFFRDKEIAVVGGGDTALEEATYLTRFASKVHLLHRRDTFRASKIMVERAEANPKIEIHTNLAVDEVLGGAKVEGLRVRDTISDEQRDVPMEGLFVAIGYRPNTEVFRDWLEVDEKGYLVVRDETGSQIEGVFIAGDVHDHRYRQAVTAAADGCKAAIDAERWLEAEGISEATTATAW